MAAGDMTIFDTFMVDLGEKYHNLETDTFKYGLVNNDDVPARGTADPRWGAAGTTDFSANEVGTGGGYTGVVTIANPVWSENPANTFTWDFDNPTTLAQDGSGPTTIYHMIVYNDTDAGKKCICAIDMGGPVSLIAGSLAITVNAAGVFTIT